MKSYGKRLGLLLPLLLAPLVTASMCGSSESPLNPSADEFTKSVSLRNLESENCVHLFTPGEDFPCCQVCPSGSRTAVMNLTRQQTYTFRAGRNGEELDTQVCRAVGGENDDFIVFWTAAGLSCEDGFSPN